MKGKPTGSMTSAGIASLILCQQAVHRKAQFLSGYKAKTRVAIRDALAWIEEYYSVDENPFGSTGWWHYYLYNLERSAVLLDMRFIGTRDWYFEGANALMSTQGGTGAMGGTINTAFAILFLKRATVPAMTSALD